MCVCIHYTLMDMYIYISMHFVYVYVVCVCVCVCVCMHFICVCIYTCPENHVAGSGYLACPIPSCSHVCACVRVSTHTVIYVRKYTNTHVCMCIYTQIRHIRVYIYALKRTFYGGTLRCSVCATLRNPFFRHIYMCGFSPIPPPPIKKINNKTGVMNWMKCMQQMKRLWRLLLICSLFRFTLCVCNFTYI